MMMVTPQISRLLFLIHVIMINVFHRKATGACDKDVLSSCVNKTTHPFLYCAQTYGDIYNALASDKTYFAIAQALYPAKKPSSVQVYVRLYGANETENCPPAKYTWSKSCLYAAFPAKALQILSLGSILIASRTQELNITIPSFCCTVSKDKRKEIIEEVLAALQDLAVLPRLQEPQLNTAECVIEGHEPNLSATGRSYYIRAILWLSFIFTVLGGLLLALTSFSILHDLKEDTSNTDSKAMHKTLTCSAVLFLVVEVVLFISSLACLGRSGPRDIYVILSLIFIEGLLVGFFLKNGCWGAFKFLPERNIELCRCCRTVWYKPSYLQIVIFLCANWTAYHFCWLMIGVMINPLWGVIVLLFICVSVAALIFAVYLICDAFEGKLIVFGLCAAFVLSVWSLFVVVGLAGQSFYGRETADDVVKLVSLSITAASFSWILSIIKGGKKKTFKVFVALN